MTISDIDFLNSGILNLFQNFSKGYGCQSTASCTQFNNLQPFFFLQTLFEFINILFGLLNKEVGSYLFSLPDPFASGIDVALEMKKIFV